MARIEIRIKAEVDRISPKKVDHMENGRLTKVAHETERNLFLLYVGGQARLDVEQHQIDGLEEGEEYTFVLSATAEQSTNKGSDFINASFKPKKLLSVDSLSLSN